MFIYNSDNLLSILTPGEVIKLPPEEGPPGGQVVVADQQGDGADCAEEG